MLWTTVRAPGHGRQSAVGCRSRVDCGVGPSRALRAWPNAASTARASGAPASSTSCRLLPTQSRTGRDDLPGCWQHSGPISSRVRTSWTSSGRGAAIRNQVALRRSHLRSLHHSREVTSMLRSAISRSGSPPSSSIGKSFRRPSITSTGGMRLSDHQGAATQAGRRNLSEEWRRAL